MKTLLNFGKTLNKTQQKQITGGYRNKDCRAGLCGFYGGSCRPCGEEEPPNE